MSDPSNKFKIDSKAAEEEFLNAETSLSESYFCTETDASCYTLPCPMMALNRTCALLQIWGPLSQLTMETIESFLTPHWPILKWLLQSR